MQAVAVKCGPKKQLDGSYSASYPFVLRCGGKFLEPRSWVFCILNLHVSKRYCQHGILMVSFEQGSLDTLYES